MLYSITEHDANGALLHTIQSLGKHPNTLDSHTTNKGTARRWLAIMRNKFPKRYYRITETN